MGGLAIFGAVFALNSAVHSYLILDYTDGDKVALNVGFYYMANAGGRLVGCLLSGVLYQVAGLAGCLWGRFRVRRRRGRRRPETPPRSAPRRQTRPRARVVR